MKFSDYLERNVELLLAFMSLSSVEDLLKECQRSSGEENLDEMDDVLGVIHSLNERIWPQSFLTIKNTFMKIRLGKEVLDSKDNVKRKVTERLREAALENAVDVE